MQKLSSLRFACSLPAVVLTALVLPLAGVVQAQKAAVVATAVPPVAQDRPTLNLDFDSALHAPNASGEAGVSSSSSSVASGDLLALAAAPANLVAADGSLQPPPYRRRRYGAPSYSDKMHNADGSNRLAFMAGGGFTVPVGSASSDYLNTSWDIEAGGGINFSKKLGVLLQFDWDNFGLPGNVLGNQQALYTSLTGDTTGIFTGLDGHTHVWSFTLNPTLNFYQGDKIGAYAVVGGGFYHKVTDFTIPTQGTGYSPYYGYYTYTANQTIDDYTSNAAGVQGGVGMTYKFSRFANERFFAEARFVHTFNQARAGDPTVTGASTGTANNLYPPNSNETSYIPITFGIRF